MIDTLYLWTMWLVLLFVFLFKMRKKYQALKRYDPRMTEYEPPENINPMICGFLLDRKLNIRDILAGIIFLHQKNIVDFEKSDPHVGLINKNRMKHAQDIVEEIAYQKGYIHYPFSFGTVLLYSLLIAIFAGSGLYLFVYQIQSGMVGFSFFEIYIYFLSFPIMIWICVLISRLTLGQYTESGIHIRNKISGFKRYLQVAEEERIDFDNSLQENPEIFTYYLAYAIALNANFSFLSQYTLLLRSVPDWYETMLFIMPRVYLDGKIINLEEIIDLVEINSH